MSGPSLESDLPVKTPGELLRELRDRGRTLAAGSHAPPHDIERWLASLDALVAALDPTPAQEALRQSEERHRSVVEGVVEGILIHQDHRIAFVNQALCRLHGYDRPGELIGKDPDVLIAPESLPLLQERRRLAPLQGSPLPEVEWQGLRRDGSRVWFQSRITPFVWDSRPAILSTRVDITERKRLEEQLRQAQKMEAVGRLAGGIAHDFNNLLTVINGYTELLLADVPPSAPYRQMLRGIQVSGERAAELTRQLLAFGRRQMLHAAPLHLNALIDQLGDTLRRTLGEGVELKVRPAADLGKVKADPAQLEQVIVHLAVNAREAMPQGGRLVLETANVCLNEADVREHPETSPGRYVMLSITDTGRGMDAATRARLFEPFFTTKEFGKGSGLGLAMVYGFVKQSGGHLDVESEPGRGTVFRIYLPRLGDEAQPVAASVFELG